MLGPEVYVAWRDNLIQKDDNTLPAGSPHSHRSTRHDVSRKSVRYNTTPNIHTIEGRENRLPMTSHEAATKIQRFWRRHIDMQVSLGGDAHLYTSLCVPSSGNQRIACYGSRCHTSQWNRIDPSTIVLLYPGQSILNSSVECIYLP